MKELRDTIKDFNNERDWQNKVKKNRKKYPVAKSRGKSLKYDELA
jgi:hypothetical protein